MLSLTKRKNILLYFLILATIFSIFSEDIISPTNASNDFITLYIHGFLTNGAKTDIFNPAYIFFNKDAYSTVSYFSGVSTDPSPYQWGNTAFSNFFIYRLSGGEGVGLPEFPDRPVCNNDGTLHNLAFLNYPVNSSKDYKILSDIFMEEIGDFNSGSRFLPEAYRQPFLALGKCEWIYKNSQSLKDFKPDIHNLEDI